MDIVLFFIFFVGPGFNSPDHHPCVALLYYCAKCNVLKAFSYFLHIKQYAFSITKSIAILV